MAVDGGSLIAERGRSLLSRQRLIEAVKVISPRVDIIAKYEQVPGLEGHLRSSDT